ncbi:hypothetical protein LOZ39_004180 [Ophidiomyces ophidiicola]|uniref:Uncharacterized protein n=1 Tax=Ophidiomyces ophidiicola TaxID=1387563 RepID=A0ACB8UUN7_9EURO|nr:hypothetical protein LOZ62_004197 [Ophidiomyces ophidiicola]KAI2019615.1 hypothetical protein LOZ46_003256 [Ophidiomyces ophidiicola]KAI2027777.1 hypothetical protein LOZ45_002560 [Ophidiomyces ophidiicola]KAI2053825.1 hypothetical protein LOZ38_001583 [Ophidiomyces ophidiicola]KAI2072852.1 hypothetical protein LOZ39_004180 [Ophidiomyces ophidiicola]
MRFPCPPMNNDESSQTSDSATSQNAGDPAEAPPSSPRDTSAAIFEDRGKSMNTLEELRQRMKDKMISQQTQLDKQTGSPQPPRSGSEYHRQTARELLSNPPTPSRAPSSPHNVKSRGPLHVRGSSQEFDPTFPFPTMGSQKRPLDHAARPREDPRILGSRSTRTPRKNTMGGSGESRTASDRPWTAPPKRDFLPSDATDVIEDAAYPTPNLYDLTLTLNADPGLNNWWSNVSRILRMHYGAERASLSVPGDATDLENVPWGQKATYYPRSWSIMNRNERSEKETTSAGSHRVATKTSGPKYTTDAGDSPSPISRRPHLMSRHSFTGYTTRRIESERRDLDETPPPRVQIRRKSLSGSEKTGSKGKTESTEGTRTKRVLAAGPSPTQSETSDDYLQSQSSITGSVATVFQVPRGLEVEQSPLIKRTGIPRLFGRTKPAVLTREYADDPSTAHTPTSIHRHKDVVQTTPRGEYPSKAPALQSAAPSQRLSNTRTAITKTPLSVLGEDVESEYVSAGEAYEEYEQVPQSPWSQSPAPSPAPLSKPEENPFFTNPEVDEDAFASSPPSHDYSESLPPHAIGVDWSKTIIHIPLLYSPPTSQADDSTLRFPVAIISILASIIPYPTNLRLSLAYLMPHLTTSFCLAQQYSELEKLLPGPLGRYNLLGLGGTFSDEGSELELVAGLAGQANYPSGEDGASVSRSVMSSPIAPSNLGRTSSAISAPSIDLASPGLRREIFLSPGAFPLSGIETLDSYFISARPNIQAIQQAKSSPDSQTGEFPSSPSSSSSQPGKAAGNDDITSKDISSISEVSPVHPLTTTSRSSSASVATQLQRDLQYRPFSDTIAQLMLNSVPLHLFLAKPPTGEVIWTNAKFDGYRRYPHESRIKDPFQNVHSREYDNVISEWTKALKTGSQFTERVRVRRLGDEASYRWFIFRANPLISATGELLYWIGSFLDVHEQHIAESKAAQERETFATDAKYRALANSIPQIVFEAAEYRGLISANQQWELYTGQSLAEAKNLGFAKHIHRDDLKKCGILHPPQVIPESVSATEFGKIMFDPQSDETPRPEDGKEQEFFSPDTATPTTAPNAERPFGRGVTEALQHLVEKDVVTMQRDENGRDSYTTEVRFRSRKGDFRWHLVRLVKVETADFGNGEASWYGTCTDINDRKKLEKELNMAMQKLNHEMESKTKFFTNMSHEIRTPLNGILGTIPFILDTQVDSDQRRMLDTIQNSSTNLRELVDNILDVSKVEAGKMNILRQWFHVRAMLEDAIDTIASRAIDKGLELNYVFEPEVPSMVYGDRFRIRQILINLIGNAVKFTSQGEIFIRCSIHDDPKTNLEESEILLNFEVIDTGKGFSVNDAQRLMHRFSQIENDNAQQHAGSGLGLFLSKQIAEMHGGRLTPTSMEGRGAKFSFYVKVGITTAQTAETMQRLHEELPARPASRAPTGGSTTSQEISPGQMSSGVQSDTSPESVSSAGYLAMPRRSNDEAAPEALKRRSAVADSARNSTDSAKIKYQNISPAPEAKATASRNDSGTLETVDSAEILAHPTMYSVLIVCPFDHAREAITQHIEQVVPFDVPANVTSIHDLDDWKELSNNAEPPTLTHMVLNLPDLKDVKEMMSNILEAEWPPPTVVIVADAYMKRDIGESCDEFKAAGKKAVVVPKPLKPSTFSPIFDPLSKRELSKDRNQAMARAMDDSFRAMSKIVKEMIGNKGHRVLLVEDDETNRAVMLKYLEKIKLISETAANGQECIDMVFAKEPGYYSLIIVSWMATKGPKDSADRTVRYPNAHQERIRDVPRDPGVGGDAPPPADSDHGAVGERDDGPDRRRGAGGVQRLRDEADQAQ